MWNELNGECVHGLVAISNWPPQLIGRHDQHLQADTLSGISLMVNVYMVWLP